MAKKNEASQEAPKANPVAGAESAVSANYNSKIEAIKDIIFGEDYAALRLSINELAAHTQAEIARVEEKYSALLADTDATINNRIDNLEMDLKSEIDRLDENKTDRFKLGKMLESLGKSLQE